jgi:ketosteroid isomerase-like protein
MEHHVTRQPPAVIGRLVDATNRHDLDALVACFAADYRSETPAHPDRNFQGREQVETNWTQIFGGVPDLTATLLRCVVDGETVWTEWHHRGTRRDGQAHEMVGVGVFELGDDVLRSVRFYLEPVQRDGLDATAGARTVVGATAAGPTAGAPGSGAST